MNKLLLIALTPLMGCAALGTPEGIAKWQAQAHSTAAKGQEIGDTIVSTVDTLGSWAPLIIDTVFSILPGIVGIFN